MKRKKKKGEKVFVDHIWGRIGIISGKYDTNAYQFFDVNNCQLGYGYTIRGNIAWCKGGNHGERLQTTGVRWFQGSTIKVIVDCKEKWEVIFECNGKRVGKAQPIVESEVYFPAIEICACEGNSYEVID